MEDMKKTLMDAGYDAERARERLDTWNRQGLNTSEAVRERLASDSFQSLGLRFGYLLFNAFLVYQSYQLSVILQQNGGWIQFIPKAFFYYTIINFVQEFFVFVIIAYATAQFARNPILLDALQDIAGRTPNPSALEVKPSKVVDTLRVFQTLQELNAKLQTMDIETTSLDSLGAMILLTENKDIEGDAADLDTAAKIFNRYDLNSDRKLDSEEIRLMLKDNELRLDDEEIQEAVNILDSKNQDGYVQFDEFVEFWRKKLAEPEIQKQAEKEKA